MAEKIKPKIVITGASGVLGHRLVQDLENNHHVYAFENVSKVLSKNCKVVRVVLTQPDQIIKALTQIKPSCVVHCAALTSPDLCETNKELTDKVNVHSTETIARICQDSGARLIYISTDLVYEGAGKYHKEEETPCPVSHYALSKLKGEEKAGKYCRNSCIVRSALIYGWSPPGRMTFIEWLIENIKARKTVNLFTDQYRSPVYLGDLSLMVSRLINTEVCGIFNSGGSERISRYEFAKKAAGIFGLDKSFYNPVLIKDIPMFAHRPADASMDITKISKAINFTPSDVTTGLMKLKEKSTEAHRSTSKKE